MRLDLHEDPAVIEMADAMDVREEVIVGYLHKIWSWASRQCHAGSVTGVTLVSLGRVTGLSGFPELMRDAGWIEEKAENGKPVVTFPNWDRWLGQSAKKRLNAAERKREERKKSPDVTKMSHHKRDKSVTTGEERRGENNNSLSLAKGFENEWTRWCNFRESIDGRRNAISEEQTLMELSRRGPEKAKRDIEFSILKSARSILDSDNDYANRGNQPKGKRSKLDL